MHVYNDKNKSSCVGMQGFSASVGLWFQYSLCLYTRGCENVQSERVVIFWKWVNSKPVAISGDWIWTFIKWTAVTCGNKLPWIHRACIKSDGCRGELEIIILLWCPNTCIWINCWALSQENRTRFTLEHLYIVACSWWGIRCHPDGYSVDHSCHSRVKGLSNATIDCNIPFTTINRQI